MRSFAVAFFRYPLTLVEPMLRSPSSSGEPPLPQSPLPDRRIAVSLCIGLILFLVLILKLFFLRNNTDQVKTDDALQLLWRDNTLAADYIPADRPAAPHTLVKPEFTPFFFQPVPINQADAELLESIDGIGPKLAGEILKLRREGCIFRDSRDLLRIPGIGARKLRDLEGKFSFAEAP